MGYAPDYFSAHVAKWMRDDLLRKGSRRPRYFNIKMMQRVNLT
jgi:hypothetical protein